jgi:anaerobic ribonucleoside-triphosphate reductase
VTCNEEEKNPVTRVACEVYSRIVGYLRPVQDWNKGKQQEFDERKTYTVPQSAVPPSDKSN